MERPELTEIETLRLENIALKYRAMESQMQSLLRDRTVVIQQIEERLPGWKWHDPDGLIPEPPIPEPYPELSPR